MRWPHLIIVLLILASVLLNLCAWAALHGKDISDPAVALVEALILSQTALVAVWGALGNSWLWLRLCGTAGICAALSWLAYPISPEPGELSATLLELGLAAGVVLATLGALRLAGFHLQNNLASSQDERTMRPGQFSIQNMLLLTAAVAVIATSMRQKMNLDRESIYLISWFSFFVALPVPATTWATLTPFRLLPRAAFAAVFTVLVLAIWFKMFALYEKWLIAFFLGENLLVILALLCVRAAGYRLTRTPLPDQSG